MSDYHTGYELCELWGIRDFQLFEYVKKGDLKPYNDLGKPVQRPNYRSKEQIEAWKSEINRLENESQGSQDLSTLPPNSLVGVLSSTVKTINYARIENLKNKIKKFNNETDEPLNWSLFNLPNDEYEAKSELESLCSYLYHIEDIKNVEKFFKIKNDKSKINYNEFKETIIKIGNEAELIYNQIKNEVGVTDKEPNSHKMRMNSALYYFRNNSDQFKKIKEAFLNDISLFIFGSSQSKRDFMRNLLKKTLSQYYPDESFSGDKAYKLYQVNK